MYSASGLFDGIYSIEDLPESVEYVTNFSDTGNPISVILNLNENAEIEEFSVFYGQRTYPNPPDQYIYWSLSLWWDVWGQIGPIDRDCLFTDRFLNAPEFSPGPEYTIYTLDLFADTYQVTCANGVSATLVREAQCSWVQRDGGGRIINQLYYRNATAAEANEFGAGRVLWAFNGQIRTDAGPYNSPAGNYGACEVSET